MKIKRTIRRGFWIVCWAVVLAGGVVLLIAAVKKRNKGTCRGYDIEISGAEEQLFIDKKDIVNLLTTNGKTVIKGKPLSSFNLQSIEQKLEKEVWVLDAELFFDNTNLLRVRVYEREPVARIFTRSGHSFYIDSSGTQLPLSDKFSARLPVFTGFPSDRQKLKGRDSVLMQQVKNISRYVRERPFWMAQAEQFNITDDWEFEMIPAVGRQVVKLGSGEDLEKKFRRLFIFYLEVLRKSGFSQYSAIDVRYSKQVVATRAEGTLTRSDSLQAIRKIEEMIRNARQQRSAASLPTESVRPLESSSGNDQEPAGRDLLPAADNGSNEDTPSGSYETPARPVRTETNNQPVNGRAPRAVMPRRNRH